MRYDYGYGGGYGRGYGSGYGYGGYGGGYGDALSPRQQMRMRERDEYYGGGYGGGYYGRGYGSRGSNGGYGNGFYDNYRGTYGNGVMNRLDVNSPYSRNMMVQRRGYGGYGDDYYGGGYGSRYGRGGGYYPRDRMSRRDIYDGYNSYYGNGYYGGGRRRMYGGVWNQDNDFIDPQPYRRGYGGDMYDRGYGGGYGRRGYGQRSLMASGTMNMNGETRIDQAQRYNREGDGNFRLESAQARGIRQPRQQLHNERRAMWTEDAGQQQPMQDQRSMQGMDYGGYQGGRGFQDRGMDDFDRTFFAAPGGPSGQSFVSSSEQALSPGQQFKRMKENSTRREQGPSSQSKAGRQGVQQQQQRGGPQQQQWQQQQQRGGPQEQQWQQQRGPPQQQWQQQRGPPQQQWQQQRGPAPQGQWSQQGQNFAQNREGRPKGPAPNQQYGARSPGQSSSKRDFQREGAQSINNIYAKASAKQNQRQLSDKEEAALLQRNFEEMTSAIKAVRVSIENKNQKLYVNKPEEFKDNANHLAKVQALLLELETLSAASEMMPALKDLTRESYHMRGALQDTEQKLLEERESWDVEFSIDEPFQTPHWDYDNDAIDEPM